MNATETREEVALQISQQNSFKSTLSALSRAIRECGDEGVAPVSDPAVGLILTKLNSFVQGSGFDRQQAISVCQDAQAIRLQKPLLIQLAEKTLSYDPDRKAAFHKEAKKQLKRLADALGYVKGEFDISSSMGGVAVGGEAILHTDHLYLQIFQGFSRFGDILYRSCDHRKDYSGGNNNYAFLKDLNDIKAFARRLNHELDGGRMPVLPYDTIGMLF
ncbi:hypothetical protein [Kiloniella sp.]|uniref:hypothetical protein n=1 Tax=Kiloniella sp. TaxID=1938587 RepID=UPI003B02E680